MRVPDPAILLCESCGYPLDGLPRAGACPECATPIARSQPSARPGTPWQRRRAPGSLLQTWWLVVTRPRKVWAEVSARPRPAASLLLVTLTVGAALPSAAVGVSTRRFGDTSPVYCVVFFAVAWLVMLALTSVEFTGIRFFGRQRGWRITPGVALVICAHASVGWLLGCAAMALAWLIAADSARIDDALLWVVVVTPFLAGMCVFSLLAGAGFHALRFVNDPVALARRSAGGAEPVEQGPSPDSATRGP